jgi:hypothetical protein
LIISRGRFLFFSIFQNFPNSKSPEEFFL